MKRKAAAEKYASKLTTATIADEVAADAELSSDSTDKDSKNS